MIGGIGASSTAKEGSRSALTRLSLSLCALGIFLAMSAVPAKGVTLGHTYDFEFGSPGSGAGQFSVGPNRGMGIAIDHSTGEVYVTDADNARVQKFDSDGNFVLTWGYGVADGTNEFQVCSAPDPCQAGSSGTGPGQFIRPTAIAVDNSGGPNDGIVYVADTNSFLQPGGRNRVFKFSPVGAYLGEIDGSDSPGGVFKALPARSAVVVDGQGFVWVGDNRDKERAT